MGESMCGRECARHSARGGGTWFVRRHPGHIGCKVRERVCVRLCVRMCVYTCISMWARVFPRTTAIDGLWTTATDHNVPNTDQVLLRAARWCSTGHAARDLRLRHAACSRRVMGEGDDVATGELRSARRYSDDGEGCGGKERRPYLLVPEGIAGALCPPPRRASLTYFLLTR